MIFYSYRSRYFLLIKFTTPLGINVLLIRESLYNFVHSKYFNTILIDLYQEIAVKLA